MYMTKVIPVLSVCLWLTFIVVSAGSKSNDKVPASALSIQIPTQSLNSAIKFATENIRKLSQLEKNLKAAGIKVRLCSPSHGLQIDTRSQKEADQIGRDAILSAKASQQIVNSFCLSHGIGAKECGKNITEIPLKNTLLEEACGRLSDVQCGSSYFRNMDGSCNDPGQPLKGKAFTAYKRLLMPNYMDGIQEPRRSVTRKPLPNARTVSAKVSASEQVADTQKTIAFLIWGQFLEHDMTHTVARKMSSIDNNIECCDPYNSNLSPRHQHPDCMQIKVEEGDPFYGHQFVFCLNYVRSLPVIRNTCTFGYIEQMNQATHFLDASQLYGPSKATSDTLRAGHDGLLHTMNRTAGDLLPRSKKPFLDCQIRSSEDDIKCFRSGDSRVNFQPLVTSMYTVWMREHNRIVLALAEMNPLWNDDRLFQEARRLVIAQMQFITYVHWLPMVLGSHWRPAMDDDSEFLSSLDPSVSNSFATAAIRFTHSLMGDKITLVPEDRTHATSYSMLANSFQRPQMIDQNNNIDSIIRGLATQRSAKFDLSYSRALTEMLYRDGEFGYDILALDIQRSRDHGLPSYNDYRQFCKLPRAKTFQDLADVISQENVALLQNVYEMPDDIDLIVGGLAEKHIRGGVVGPTLGCIIKDQFQRTRYGDKFFYDNHRHNPYPFTLYQAKEIRQTSLARIFCDNVPSIQRMQPNVFEKISSNNRLTDCNDNSIPTIDLEAWRAVPEQNNKYHSN